MAKKIKLTDAVRVLEFLAPVVGTIPTAGPPLAVVIGTAIQLCKLVEGVSENREALRALVEHEALLAASLSSAARDLASSARQSILKPIDDFSAVLNDTEKLAIQLLKQDSSTESGRGSVRGFLRNTFHAQDHAQEIRKLESRLNKTMQRFEAVAAIQQLKSLEDLMIIALSNDIKWLRAELKPVHEARFDAANAPTGCLEGTRVDLLKILEAWALATDSERVLWLSGLAGTGKSTLARSACELFLRHGVLLASFFISRASENRRNPARLLQTLVYSCTEHYPEFFATVHDLLLQHPETTALPISEQVDRFFLGPVNGTLAPDRVPIIVIDAFDECQWQDGCEGGSLLPALLHAVRSSPLPFRLLITSRMEKTISDVFAVHEKHQPIRLHDIDKAVVKKDIELYLRHSLGEIARAHGIKEPWPSPEDLALLVEKAGQLFVFASTAVRFLGSHYADPVKCLAALLHPSLDSDSDSPFAILDALYTDILRDALRENSGREAEALLRLVVGALVFLQDPLPVSAISGLLGTYALGTRRMVERLGAVALYSETEPIRLYHPSFADFAADAHRCQDERFRIVPAEHHARLAERCLRLMNGALKEDICEIGDASLANEDVPDLAGKIANRIPEELQYACRHWLTHLSLASSPPPSLVEQLTAFANAHVPHWIEALSLLQALPVALVGIPKALTWVAEHIHGGPDGLSEILGDTDKTIRAYHNHISTTALQVYCTVAAFMPHCALHRKMSAASPPRVRLLSVRESGWSSLISARKGHEKRINSVAFMPDGIHLVSGSEDGTVRVWNSRTLERVATFVRDGQESVETVACSPDGDVIASAGKPAGVALWDARTRKLLRTLEGQFMTQSLIAFSPDGSRIAAASHDETVRVWDVGTGETLLSMSGHTHFVRSVAFSPDGTRIASGSDDRFVKIWDAATGELVLDLKNHDTRWITSVAFSPDGARVASAGHDGVIKISSVETGALVRSLAGHKDWVDAVWFSSFGPRVFSGSRDHTLRTWDPATGEDVATLTSPHGAIRSIALAPDEMRLAAATGDGFIEVWDAEALQDVITAEGHEELVTGIAVAPDGETFATSSFDATVRIWTTSTAACVNVISHERALHSVAFSADGRTLASGDSHGRVRLLGAGAWSETGVVDSSCILTKHETGPAHTLAFSPDGSRVASGSWGIVCVWNTATLESVCVIRAQGHYSIALAFSPDATRIASGTINTTGPEDRTQIFDVGTGERVAALEDQACRIHSIVFDEDGRHVASRGLDGSVHVGVVPSSSSESGDGQLSATGDVQGVEPLRFMWQPTAPVKGSSAEGWLYFVGGTGRRSRRVCWFPADRRPDAASNPKYAWYGDVVIVGSRTNRLTVLDVSAATR